MIFITHTNENERHKNVIHVFQFIKNMFDNEHHCQTLTRAFCLIKLGGNMVQDKHYAIIS